jgi:hypothetical protein
MIEPTFWYERSLGLMVKMEAEVPAGLFRERAPDSPGALVIIDSSGVDPQLKLRIGQGDFLDETSLRGGDVVRTFQDELDEITGRRSDCGEVKSAPDLDDPLGMIRLERKVDIGDVDPLIESLQMCQQVYVSANGPGRLSAHE